MSLIENPGPAVSPEQDPEGYLDWLRRLPAAVRNFTLERLPVQLRERLLELERARRLRQRERLDPIPWVCKTFGIEEHTIVWSLFEDAYRASGREIPPRGPALLDAFMRGQIGNGWGGWDGTPDGIAMFYYAIARGYNVAILSGTGLTKTYNLGRLSLWFLANRPNKHGNLVQTFSTDARAMRKRLWGEIGSGYEGGFEALYPESRYSRSAMELLMRPGKADASRWGIFGITPEETADEEMSGGAQGDHAGDMLSIVDEGPTVRNSILASVAQTSIGEFNPTCVAGNPDDETDTLSEFASKPGTVVIRLSAHDFVNVVTGDNNIIPGATTKRSIATRIRDDFGGNPNAPLALSRIRGLIPSTNEACLFTSTAIDNSKPLLLDRLLATQVDTMRECSDYVGLQTTLKDAHGSRVAVPSADLDVVAAALANNDPVPLYEVDRIKVHDFYVDQDAQRNVPVKGVTVIYYAPEHTHIRRYILMADIAGSNPDGDEHGCVVFDRIMRRVVCVISMNGDANAYIDELLRIHALYRIPWPEVGAHHFPKFGWEANGVGKNFHNMDKRLPGLPEVYRMQSMEAATKRRYNKYGWNTGINRPKMEEALRAWGTEVEYRPERMVSFLLWRQCKTFIKHTDGRYRAKKGRWFYDDLVMSLAMALMIDQVMPKPQLIRVDREPVKPLSQRVQRHRGASNRGHSTFEAPLPDSL